jgi:hypothetical protein
MKFLAVIIPSLILAGCSQRAVKTTTTETRKVDRQVAKANDAALVTEVEFQKGSSELTDESKQKLSNILGQANNRGKIDEIKIISWADLSYPSEARGKLSRDQRNLASNRSNEVQKYVKDQADGYVDVDTYNMAERPNSFEKWFNTSDNKVKKSLEESGIPTTADGSLALPDKTSTAMVLVVLE